MSSNYRDLEIFKKSFELFLEIHQFTLLLPRFEQYELGSQIRRSADSVVTNIVEGYGRRKYKAEFERFIIFSHASNDETIIHLEKILKLYPKFEEKAVRLLIEYQTLGAQIFRFEKYIQGNWNYFS